SLARPDKVQRQPLHLSHMVRKVTASLGGLPEFVRARVLVEVAADEPPILASASEIKQVVLNLMINALQAVRNQEPARITIALSPAGDSVRRTVANNGVGMDPQVRRQVFEPFFTHERRSPNAGGDGRAAPASGMGLGLAISQAIVREHGG